jgi:hypothetical protein
LVGVTIAIRALGLPSDFPAYASIVPSFENLAVKISSEESLYKLFVDPI